MFTPVFAGYGRAYTPLRTRYGETHLFPPTEGERSLLMLKKVAFTMYPVRDVARARAFYE